ncbi:sigma-70 family RNA polymerase sigma factor [Paenibacillus spongiae]|uniref:Sigma-70 family RNA polymerase sigma factor n=1 Tax=Paenibacillus spongiae TaxID=2909671 RepID=A0ABY5SAS0_9BACL|nr:sigma-70 family RNA polymerase sigma factor [Paenibacillus spongiae]UVI29907.1 sigma-70 family RNA polymerase sigma factor [Paenibacillus spongiae]
MLRHTKDAEDALQEAFVRIYLSLPQYRGQGFKAWASRIAVNIAIDAQRKRMRKAEVLIGSYEGSAHTTGDGHAGGERSRLGRTSDNAAESIGAGTRGTGAIANHSPPAEVEVLERERCERVRELVEEMPVGYGSVVRSYYLEDKNQREIAAQERIELKSVESRLYRAKRWMRKHWKEEDLE